MNKLKKIGLTALAGSLVATSVFAGTMEVTGSASINLAGGDKQATGNGWSMNDSITFSGGGEMDNGWNVTAKFLLDNSDGRASDPGSTTASQIFDNRSVTIDMNEAGTLEFWGQAGDGVVSATDDKLPAAYEESWYGATGPGKGAATPNMFYYSNSSVIDGANFMASYAPSGSVEVNGSTEYGLEYTGVDNLTVGFASGDDKGAGAGSEISNRNLWVSYVWDSITVGYQMNKSDSEVAASDTEYKGYGISYAVSEEMSISLATSEVDYESNINDQESTAFGVSYVMGSMTIAGSHHTHDNAGGLSTNIADRSNYEIDLSFAF